MQNQAFGLWVLVEQPRKAVNLMREILFRGKHHDGEWVEGNLFIPDKEDTPTQICIGTNVVRVSYEIIPETVGQYTGLTDKNGKKIFEGDIVEGADFTVEDGGYGVVSFDEGAFEVNGNNICGTFHENYWGKEFEVIGNIHDNPELFWGVE